ncbi:MAG: DNA cytosine methyltransferase [Kiritimatiellae bacterium]|jgi:DNA (cytosine-5)-methyltransferase 1|nr:DNA cytosine methyltransferase [Kiritimatiellia bacterium]MDD4340880.1 DNA cytosine methyltransferase [Kiritimatiellia bacterium]
MSLGFEQAGFDVIAAVELDPVHAAVHHFNFPDAATLSTSVVGLDAHSILQRHNETDGKGGVDVVCGGAPCQGFSLIGQRMLDDPRNQLVRQFVRLVLDLDAKYFVFENVKGLTVGKHRKFLQLLISEFEERGYAVMQPWRVLNARNYGVPQHRERLFLLGAKAGYHLPEYPEIQTTDEPDLFSSTSVVAVPTCRDALEDIPDNEQFEELMTVDAVRVEDWKPKSKFAREMHCLTEDCWHFGYPRKWDARILTSSMRTAHTDISRRRFQETSHGDVEPISRFFKLSPDGQSNTLRAGTDSARGAFTSPRPIHYGYNRCVSVREMARLHGYPDWFRFHVTKWHGGRQIGNSVPPPLARAVASSIIRALGVKPQRPHKTLALGSPSLLAVDMTEAAKFWDVEVPIKKRDRKNGRHKRKQHEIENERLTARRC